MQILRSVSQFRAPSQFFVPRGGSHAGQSWWAPIDLFFKRQKLPFLKSGLSTHLSKSLIPLQKRLIHQTSVEPIHQKSQSQKNGSFYFSGAIAAAVLAGCFLDRERLFAEGSKKQSSKLVLYFPGVEASKYWILSSRMKNPVRFRQIFPTTSFPHPPQDFTGREEFLKELHKKCQKNGRVAVTGLGGMGKTSTCRKYAEQYGHCYQFVRYIESDQIEDALFKLAKEFGISEILEPEERLDQLKSKLDELQGKYLLIFDGLDDPKTIKRLLNCLPKKGILFSSRQTSFLKTHHFETIELGPMAREKAVDYLVDKVSDQDQEQAGGLAKELGYLPLALKHAAAYMRRTGIGCQDYLDEYTKYSVELFKAGHFHLENEEEQTILTTWTVSLNAIEKEHPGSMAKELLNFFSILGRAPIPLELVEKWYLVVALENSTIFPKWISSWFEGNGSSIMNADVLDALGHLLDYSMITRSSSGIYEVHPLVQDVMKHKLDVANKERMLRQLIPLLSDFLKKHDHTVLLEREAMRPFIPHIQKIIELALAMKIQDKRMAALFTSCGEYYFSDGRYGDAYSSFMNALDIDKELFGEKNLNTARSYSNVGSALGKLGAHKEVLEFLKKGLDVRIELLGEKHPDTASSYYCLGSFLLRFNRVDPAVLYLMKALELRREVLGENHPDTALSYNKVGQALWKFGQQKEAMLFKKKGLKLSRKLLGEWNLQTAMGYKNVGASLKALGMNEEGEQYEKKALESFKRGTRSQILMLGENHPKVAESYESTGHVFLRLGKFKEALEIYTRALKIRKKTLGEKNSDTASSYDSVGLSLLLLHKFEEALRYKQKALEIRKKLYGEVHPEVAESYNSVGRLLDKLDRRDEAQECKEKARAIEEELAKAAS